MLVYVCVLVLGVEVLLVVVVGWSCGGVVVVQGLWREDIPQKKNRGVKWSQEH